jgi:hypothetical protein
MNSFRAPFVCLILTFSAIANAQIVECVDANGKKSYSQSCATGTEQNREIDLPAPVKPSVPNAVNDAAKKKLADQEKEFAKRRQERLDAEAKEAEQEKRRVQAARDCAYAKSRLEVLQSGRQFKRADPQTGEHVPMDASQRQTEIENLNGQIQASCE